MLSPTFNISFRTNSFCYIFRHPVSTISCCCRCSYSSKTNVSGMLQKVFEICHLIPHLNCESREFFLSMLKNFVRTGRMLYTIAYSRHTLHEYATGTPDVRYSYAGISKDFCTYENYFINFHTLLIRYSHTQ